ncbi:MAG: CIA30 family protein [Rhodothermales bacterium]|nr:CIA30 family protein [Rhodothermales bacterium]MBO6778988.1 CIA30 family protein [Rhodothermales bacterium]
MHLVRFPALALGVFLAACSDSPRSVPLVSGTVDTFEDGNHINTANHPWQAIADGAGTRSSLDIVPGGFYSVSTHFMEVAGVRPSDATGSRVVGVRSSIAEFPPAADPSRATIPRDASGFDGLSLALRGTPGTYIVQIGTASITDFDFYNAYVEVGQEWSEYRLPFSAFRQEGFGTPVPWSGEDITHVAVFVNLDGYFTFGVDDVRFHQD